MFYLYGILYFYVYYKNQQEDIYFMNTHRQKNLIIIYTTVFAVILVIIAIMIFMFKSRDFSGTGENTGISEESSDGTQNEDKYYCSLTAEDFIDSITIGWNLGNSLDCCVDEDKKNTGNTDSSFYETAWKNPVVSKELIDAVADAGFDSIRIPVTWYYNTYRDDNNRLCIYDSWIKRVEEVVNYALDNNLYVILDSHHDGQIIWAGLNDLDKVEANVIDLWSQIADYFKDYDEHLIFDAFNEINSKDTSWKINSDYIKATNILNQTFVNTVRSCGGYNKSRLLVCSPYLNRTDEDILNSFILPSDTCQDRLLVEIHSYNPSYNQDIDELFSRLQNFSKEVGAPVFIGEFGTKDNFVPSDLRTEHASNYIARANEYGIRCFWWDDGDGYRLFDRNTCSVTAPDMLSALMNPTEFKTDNLSSYSFSSIEDYSYATIDSKTGNLVDSSSGSLTLNVNDCGLKVTSDSRYRISLVAVNSADGLRISGISFYDSNKNFINYISANSQTYYDVETPSNAAYMKISMYNPWGKRSFEDYTEYIQKNDLYLQITEYKM